MQNYYRGLLTGTRLVRGNDSVKVHWQCATCPERKVEDLAMSLDDFMFKYDVRPQREASV